MHPSLRKKMARRHPIKAIYQRKLMPNNQQPMLNRKIELI